MHLFYSRNSVKKYILEFSFFYYGTQQNILNTEVSLFQGCPLGGVPLHTLLLYPNPNATGTEIWEGQASLPLSQGIRFSP